MSARYGSQNFDAGSFAGSAGTDFDYGLGGVPVPDGSTIDIVLRGDPTAAARQTVDTFEVWDGELVFPNVRVGQVK